MSFGITNDEQGWDRFVISNGGCFLQSWGWSQFQEALGREVFRVRLAASDTGDTHETISQFLLVQQGLPLGMKYLYVPRGPVIGLGTDRPFGERIRASLGAALDAGNRAKAVFVRIDWPFCGGSGRVTGEELRGLGFHKFGHVQPEHTVIVDLTQYENTLLDRMKQKTRYNIKVAERHGVTVTEAEYDNAHLLKNDVDLFWRLLLETSKRDGFHTHERAYYEKMIDVLSPRHHKGGELVVRLLLATHEGQAIAGGLFAEYGGTVTYLHGASLSAKRSVMAPYKLHWEAMRRAKSRGFSRYDFWGVAPEEASDNHPWSGVTRFKEGFGGYRESYLGAWDIPRRPVVYAAYRLMRQLTGRKS